MKFHKNIIILGIGIFVLWAVVQVIIILLFQYSGILHQISTPLQFAVLLIEFILKIFVYGYIGYKIARLRGGYIEALLNIVIVMLAGLLLSLFISFPTILYTTQLNLFSVLVSITISVVIDIIISAFAILAGVIGVWWGTKQKG